MGELKIIGRIFNDFSEKFGIPRQSGIIEIESKIIFEQQYRCKEAFKGIEKFNYLWLIWDFSEAHREEWSPTVRPPKLGGNTRAGVFATRSPFRPNPIGLSSVKLKSVEFTEKDGPVITVTGADLMNNTPIYDIKPYINYADSHPDANNGFALSDISDSLDVNFPKDVLSVIPFDKQENLLKILAQDPRPAYKKDGEHVYGLHYSDYNIRFTISDNTLSVISAEKIKSC